VAALYRRVTQAEVTALSLETLRLIGQGSAASSADWGALWERKIGILERIAMDPGPFVDEEEGAHLQELARREAVALRLGVSARWGEASCL
jgi:hypothetical protein